MKYIQISLLVFILCFNGCKDDSELESELQFYLDQFEVEANARGLTFENQINSTEIHLVEIITSGVLGQCVRVDAEPNEIHIDRNFWLNEATDLQKEFIVFHELGHCILNRGHLNDANGQGECISIMYDGNSPQCMLNYNPAVKEEMVDELFNN